MESVNSPFTSRNKALLKRPKVDNNNNNNNNYNNYNNNLCKATSFLA